MIMATFDALAEKLDAMNTPGSLSRATGIPVSTLSSWRGSGDGPRFVHLNRKILYPKEEVLVFMRAHVYSNVGEYSGESR
jgi:hypothetical protein